MANTFSFQLDEHFLQNYAEYVQHLREVHPEKTFMVQISIDLIPDGTGYEASPPEISVVEVKEVQGGRSTDG